MTLQEFWDSSIPCSAPTRYPWAKPILPGYALVEVKGAVLCPRRVATDGHIFRLDVALLCGRTLCLLLPRDYPCELISSAQRRPYPKGYSDERFGFPPRPRDRPVTDADNLLLDLTQ
jgi:hypothetical protein